MNREANLVLLSDIIKDYRKGELEFTIDVNHINKWLSQFSPENQDVILQETLNVFQKWYFSNEGVDEIIDSIPEHLQKKYGYQTIQSVCKSVCFLNNQKDGNSQHKQYQRKDNIHLFQPFDKKLIDLLFGCSCFLGKAFFFL